MAWRLWVLDDALRRGHPVALQSPAFGQSWPVREALRAVCEHSHSYAPYEGCQCGIHGLQRAFDVLDAMAHLSGGWTFFVVGRVALWGSVIPGQRGWRAQYGYPARLAFVDKTWLPEGARAGVRASLEAYGVPVSVGLTGATFRPLGAS